VFKIY